MSYIIFRSDGEGFEGIKTKQTHPYNYDPIVQYRAPGGVSANGTVYSDRLFQWDYKKHNDLCTKHFGNVGQYWDSRDPQKIETFLREWMQDEKLRLVTITEYCNQASGFPVWRFDTFSTK